MFSICEWESADVETDCNSLRFSIVGGGVGAPTSWCSVVSCTSRVFSVEIIFIYASLSIRLSSLEGDVFY